MTLSWCLKLGRDIVLFLRHTGRAFQADGPPWQYQCCPKGPWGSEKTLLFYRSSSVASQTVSLANANLWLPLDDVLDPGTVSAVVTLTSAMSNDSTTHGAFVCSDMIDTWQLPPPPPLSQTQRCCTPTPAGRSDVVSVTRVANNWGTWAWTTYVDSHGYQRK